MTAAKVMDIISIRGKASPKGFEKGSNQRGVYTNTFLFFLFFFVKMKRGLKGRIKREGRRG